LICPFIDRLILIGVLPEPEKYHVVWPDMEAIGAQQKAQIGLIKVQTLAAYVGGNVPSVMSPADLYTEIMDVEPEKAAMLLQNVTEGQESGEGFYGQQQAEQQQALEQAQGQQPQVDKDGNPIEAGDGQPGNGQPPTGDGEEEDNADEGGNEAEEPEPQGAALKGKRGGKG
jgi:hypothetical protein